MQALAPGVASGNGPISVPSIFEQSSSVDLVANPQNGSVANHGNLLPPSRTLGFSEKEVSLDALQQIPSPIEEPPTTKPPISKEPSMDEKKGEAKAGSQPKAVSLVATVCYCEKRDNALVLLWSKNSVDTFPIHVSNGELLRDDDFFSRGCD